MKKNLKFLVLIFAALLISTVAHANAIVDLKDEWQGYIASGTAFGFLTAGGAWIIGDLFQISWIQHKVQKYKEGVVAVIIICAIAWAMDSQIAEVIAKAGNPFGV